MSIEQAKSQVAKIQQSAKTDRWKHEEPVIQITKAQAESTDRIITTLQAVFPGWRASMKSNSEIVNIKRIWAEEIIKTKHTTGNWPNIANGIEVAKKSESDFFPSIGKFLSWCEQDDSENGPQAMLRRFNRGGEALTYIEQVTRSRCGYKAKRMPQEKGDALFLKTLKEVKGGSIKDRPLAIENKSNPNKTIFTKRENQAEINNAGLASLPKID